MSLSLEFRNNIRKSFKECDSLEDLCVFINNLSEFNTIVKYKSNIEVKPIRLKSLEYLIYSKTNKYGSFQISKKSGGVREILAPNTALMNVQRLLLIGLETLYLPKEVATGFIQGRSILSNAQRHTGKKYVYNLDLSNFFPSITFGRVWSVLHKLKQTGLHPDVARFVASLCCNNGLLPQGAPTSPVLSNFVCIRLDAVLAKLAKSNGLVYSRYADDITFSSNRADFNEAFRKELFAIIKAQGFKINLAKERLQCFNVKDREGNLIRERQEVTGIVVNKKPNVSKTYRRNLQATIHNWEKHGYKVAAKLHEKYYTREKGFQRYNGQIPRLEMVVGGKLEYMGMIRGKDDPIYMDLKLRYDTLCMKSKYNNEDILELLNIVEEKGPKAMIEKFYDKRNLNEKE